MNNQCFGDNRDLFKYDLVYEIMTAKYAGLPKRFTFIPMLTPDVLDNKVTKREGEQRNRCKAKAGWKNNDLRVFLDKFQDKDKRDIRKLTGFFKKQGVEMTIHPQGFCHAKREAYFREAENKLLPKSLIFVDPDIGMGLEVKRPREKHILSSEVKDLYRHMDNSSLLMIFQFFPYEKREPYLRRISEKLKEEVSNSPVYISDNQIVFFFLTKAKSIRNSLVKVLGDYKKIYPKLTT